MTALLARRLPPQLHPADPASLIWLAFTICVCASMLPMLTGTIAGPFGALVAVVGSGGCGWLWLFSRCLFRAEKPVERWTLYIVAAIIAVEGTYALVGGTPPVGPLAEAYRVLANTEGFICVGALVLVFAEVFSGYSRDLSKKERRFRLMFGGTFAVLIALTILWVLNAADHSLGGRWREPVVLFSALVGVVGTRFCISFRRKNPLVAARKPKTATRFEGDELLARRILETLREDRKFTVPELKVADLADLLGEQEYRVTQCITGSLGFQNFNQLINSHRIEYAKEALADPANDGRPILSIAFDCGFNSVGPFNRAFKRQVGMTPRQFRTGHSPQGMLRAGE